MIAWLSQNWGTILVCLILAGIIAAIVCKMIRDKKAGRSACCGDCKHCAGGCASCRAHSNHNK